MIMMADELTDHFENIFDKLLSGFRKKHGCQTLMLKLLKTGETASRKTEGLWAVGQSEQTAQKLYKIEKTASQTWADAKRMA